MRLINDMDFMEQMQRHGYRRDFYMTGNEHDSRGLDNIPDDD